MKKKIYCALAAINQAKQLVSAVAISEDGDILGGVVMPISKRSELPQLMGIGSDAMHDRYIERYGLDGYELEEFVWEPDKSLGFQAAQQHLMTVHPEYAFDPWNPKPFWCRYAKMTYTDSDQPDAGAPEEEESRGRFFS